VCLCAAGLLQEPYVKTGLQDGDHGYDKTTRDGYAKGTSRITQRDRHTEKERHRERERRALYLSIYPVCAHRARTCLRAYRLVVVRGKDRAYALAKTLYCQRAVTEFVQQQMATIAGTFRSACMSVCVCVCVPIHVCMQEFVCMFAEVRVCTCMCVSWCMHVCMCVRVYVGMIVCVLTEGRTQRASRPSSCSRLVSSIAPVCTHTQSFCLSSRWRPCTDADYLCVYVSMYLCVCLSGCLGARQRVRGPPSAWPPCLSSCGGKCARRYALSRCLLADTDTN
jgi:hypothetical protein